MDNIVYNNFYGSIAETNTHMRVGDCAYMENLDGRTEPEFLKLNREVTVKCATGQGLPILVLDSYILSDDGTIRNLFNGVVVYTAPGPFVTGVMFGDYFIGFYKDGSNIKIVSIPTDPLTGTWLFGSAVTNFGSLVNPTTNLSAPFSVPAGAGIGNISIINNSEDILYFSIDKKVYITNYQFTPSLIIENPLTFESYVSGMTRDQNSINIYLWNGRKYLWGGIGYKTVEGYSDLGVSRLQSVGQAKNVDYFIASGFTGISNMLYVSQGQTCKQIRQASSIKDSTVSGQQKYKFAFGTQCRNDSWIASGNNLIFLPSEEQTGIISYGIRNEINSYGFVNEYMSSNGNYFDVGCLSFGTDVNAFQELYMGVKNGNGDGFLLTQQYDVNNLQYKYQTEGVWYTKKEINSIPQQNRVQKYRFRYELPAGTTIEIYYCKNNTNNYTLLTSLPSGQTDFVLMTSNPGTRSELQHKIVMKTNNVTVTPRLQSMIIMLEPSKRGVSVQ